MRLVGLMLALGLFFLLGWWLFGRGLEEMWDVGTLAGRFEEARSWAWLVGIGLLVADLVLPIPGTVVMSALGAVYGFWIGALLAAAGSMLAGMCGYGIGRIFSEQRTKKWLGQRDFNRGRELFVRRGAWVVAISRALPILPEVIACTAGLLRMPFAKFTIALACGSLPMALLFSWIGTVGREDPVWGLAFSLLLPAILWTLASLLRRA
jgi:uncharacterized membrane protein YdjX (TVP38/TMEM64 family)